MSSYFIHDVALRTDNFSLFHSAMTVHIKLISLLIKAMAQIKRRNSDLHIALQKCFMHTSIIFHIQRINVHCDVFHDFFLLSLWVILRFVYVRKEYFHILK